jgi:calcineurin-like phosphoesterase family protein
MLWFTADTHFGHAAIVTHCGRPFRDVYDMDTSIIQRINLCVRADDTLYHLGDFAWTGRWREYRERIACSTIHLVIGNHDTSRRVKQAIKDGLFASVGHYVRLKSPVRAVMCHYPIEHWEPTFAHLHGHTHGGLVPLKPGRLDVGVDAQSFAPVSEGVVRELAETAAKVVTADRHAEVVV